MTTPQKLADLKALNRLLDHALALPPDHTKRWVAELPTHVTQLAPRLRRLLEDRRAGKSTDFMAQGPRLDAAADEPTVRAGDLAGPYRLLRELGRGGMCTVWLAEHEALGPTAQFAVKLPRRKPTPDIARRMAEERKITSLMAHPHVARLRDASSDEAERPYLVLEHVEGQTLTSWCASHQPSAAERLRVFLQLAHAVAYVHSRGVIHRDLKPANVLVDEVGQVRLLDFGIASQQCPTGPADSATCAERSLTPGYASPEQTRGETTDERSDVYSLGVILFELLTGNRPASPLQVTSSANVAGSLGNRPLELGDILRKALAILPEGRHANASALAREVQSVLRAAATAAPIGPCSERRRQFKLPRRGQSGLGAARTGHPPSPPRWN